MKWKKTEHDWEANLSVNSYVDTFFFLSSCFVKWKEEKIRSKRREREKRTWRFDEREIDQIRCHQQRKRTIRKKQQRDSSAATVLKNGRWWTSVFFSLLMNASGCLKKEKKSRKTEGKVYWAEEILENYGFMCSMNPIRKRLEDKCLNKRKDKLARSPDEKRKDTSADAVFSCHSRSLFKQEDMNKNDLQPQ